MSSSSASVTVANSPNMYAGGLVGSQGYGSVEDSYSTGEISNEPPDYFVFTSGITSYQFHNTIKTPMPQDTSLLRMLQPIPGEAALELLDLRLLLSILF